MIKSGELKKCKYLNKYKFKYDKKTKLENLTYTFGKNCMCIGARENRRVIEQTPDFSWFQVWSTFHVNWGK